MIIGTFWSFNLLLLSIGLVSSTGTGGDGKFGDELCVLDNIL